MNAAALAAIRTTASVAATNNKLVISPTMNGYTVKITRRRTRVRITVSRHNHQTGHTTVRSDFQDFTDASQADTVFAHQITRWHAWHQASQTQAAAGRMALAA